MTWTFPIRLVPSTAPSVPEFRRLAILALETIAAEVRSGSCPVAIAPVPVAPSPGWSHWHPWPELFLQLSGSSRFDTPIGDVHVEGGNCLVMPPLFAHHEYLGRSQAKFCNFVFTIIDCRFAYHMALPSPVIGTRPHVAQPDLIDPADHHLGLAALVGLAKSGAPGQEDARAGWLLAFCAWAATAIAAAPPPGFSGSERVRRTHELVRARLGSAELSVGQLGTWIGCHPDHLARLFRQETGETIVGHIRRQRLERARDLLLDHDVSIADIGRLVGFPDPTYFSRIYRHMYGIPPGTMRRAALNRRI